jgi:hypothetical protein
MIEMRNPKQKAALDKAVARAADIIGGHLRALTPAASKAMRRDIHKLAVKSSRSARRGKVSRSRETADPRPLSRSSARPA